MTFDELYDASARKLASSEEAAPPDKFDAMFEEAKNASLSWRPPASESAVMAAPLRSSDAPTTQPKPKTSTATAFGLGAARSVVPGAAGLAAFGPGAALGAEIGALGGPLAPVTVPLGGLIGGLTSSYLASKGTAAVQEAVVPTTELERTAQQEHPTAAMLGGVAGQSVTGGFNPLRAAGAVKTLGKLGTGGLKSITAAEGAVLKDVGGGAVISAGMGAAERAIQGQDTTTQDILTDLGLGALSSKPTALGRKVEGLGTKAAALIPQSQRARAAMETSPFRGGPEAEAGVEEAPLPVGRFDNNPEELKRRQDVLNDIIATSATPDVLAGAKVSQARVTTDGKDASSPAHGARMMEQIARLLGQDVIMVEGAPLVNGIYTGQTSKGRVVGPDGKVTEGTRRVILVSADAMRSAGPDNLSAGVFNTFGHEVWHDWKSSTKAETDPLTIEAVKRVEEVVRKSIPKDVLESRSKELRKLDAYKNITEDALFEEHMGDLLGEAFGRKDFWHSVKGQSQTAYQRLVSHIVRVLENIGFEVPEKFKVGATPEAMAEISRGLGEVFRTRLQETGRIGRRQREAMAAGPRMPPPAGAPPPPTAGTPPPPAGTPPPPSSTVPSGTQPQQTAKPQEPTNAVQKPEPTQVFQRQQETAGEAGGQRGQVEPVEQGQEAARKTPEIAHPVLDQLRKARTVQEVKASVQAAQEAGLLPVSTETDSLLEGLTKKTLSSVRDAADARISEELASQATRREAKPTQQTSGEAGRPVEVLGADAFSDPRGFTAHVANLPNGRLVKEIVRVKQWDGTEVVGEVKTDNGTGVEIVTPEGVAQRFPRTDIVDVLSAAKAEGPTTPVEPTRTEPPQPKQPAAPAEAAAPPVAKKPLVPKKSPAEAAAAAEADAVAADALRKQIKGAKNLAEKTREGLLEAIADAAPLDTIRAQFDEAVKKAGKKQPFKKKAAETPEPPAESQLTPDEVVQQPEQAPVEQSRPEPAAPPPSETQAAEPVAKKTPVRKKPTEPAPVAEARTELGDQWREAAMRSGVPEIEAKNLTDLEAFGKEAVSVFNGVLNRYVEGQKEGTSAALDKQIGETYAKFTQAFIEAAQETDPKVRAEKTAKLTPRYLQTSLENARMDALRRVGKGAFEEYTPERDADSTEAANGGSTETTPGTGKTVLYESLVGKMGAATRAIDAQLRNPMLSKAKVTILKTARTITDKLSQLTPRELEEANLFFESKSGYKMNNSAVSRLTGVERTELVQDALDYIQSSSAVRGAAAKFSAREERPQKDADELLTFGVSANTDKIRGLAALRDQAAKGDKRAGRILSDIAFDSLKYLTSGIPKAEVEYDRTTGLYGGYLEPSVGVRVRFSPEDKGKILATLERFGSNFKQQQVHVRSNTDAEVGTDFGDGSVSTPMYRITLTRPLKLAEALKLQTESGAEGFTLHDGYMLMYHVGEFNYADLEKFNTGARKAINLLRNLGADGEVSEGVTRLWIYGEPGQGKRVIPYEQIRSDFPKPSAEARNVSARRIAIRIAGRNVIPAEQAKTTTAEQAATQTEIMQEYAAMPPTSDRPSVDKSFNELISEIREQYEALPVRVELWDGRGEPYKSSGAMRDDVLENNHLFILRSTPENFGPEGAQYKEHVGTQKTEFEDINGVRMTNTELFRAVHDYYAHTLSTAAFGPRGEEAAWRNHMAMTKSPWARWALTTLTRGQNSYVNFRPGVENIPLAERGFAEQKIGLLPIKYAKIGDPFLDAQMDEVARQAEHMDGRGTSKQPVVSEVKDFREVTPEEFHQLLGDIKEVHQTGASVDLYNPAEYAGLKLLSSADGLATVAIKKDGNIVAIAKHPDSNMPGDWASKAIKIAVKNGGWRGDSFDTDLPVHYSRAGLRVVARMPWDEQYKPKGWNYDNYRKYNNGRPDVLFYVYDGTKKAYDKTAGKRVATYEEGTAEQERVAEEEGLVPPEQKALGAKLSARNPVLFAEEGIGGRVTRWFLDKNRALRAGELKKLVPTANKDLLEAVDRAVDLYPGTTGEEVRQLAVQHVDPLVKNLERLKQFMTPQAIATISGANSFARDFMQSAAMPKHPVRKYLAKARELTIGGGRSPTAVAADLWLYARHAQEANAYQRSVDPTVTAGSGMTDAEAAQILRAFSQAGLDSKLAPIGRRVDAINKLTRDTWLTGELLPAQAVADLNTRFRHYVPLKGDQYNEMARGTGFQISGKETFRREGRTTAAFDILGHTIAQAEQALDRKVRNLTVGRAMYDLVKSVPNGPWRELKPGMDGGENVFVVKENGVEKRIAINEDIAPMLIRSLKNLDPQQLSRWASTAHTIVRGYSNLLTSWNPEFALPNLARDFQDAFANAAAENQKVVVKALADPRNGIRSMRGLAQALRNNVVDADGRAAAEFLAMGGAVGKFNRESAAQVSRDIRMELEGTGLAKGAKSLVDGLEYMNRVLENSTRLTVYKSLVANGTSKTEAARVAKNITVNFDRRGEMSPWMNTAFLFFNASAQGTARVAKALSGPNGRKIAAALFAIGYASDSVNRGISGDDNDDGRNDWDEKPDYTKENNLIIPLPDGKDIRVPLPYGWNIFVNMGRKVSEYKAGVIDEKKGLTDLLKYATRTFSPVGEDPMPTLLRPYIELRDNKDWKGDPIYPENMFDKAKTPASEMASRKATGLSKDIASKVNVMTGGTAVEPGWISIHPDVIDYLAGYLTGGTGKFIGRATEIPTKIKEGELQPGDIPVVRRLFSATPKGTGTTDFYAIGEKIDTLHARIKEYRERKDFEAANRLRDENRGLFSLKGRWDATRKSLKNLRQRLDKAGTPEERQALRSQIDKLVAANLKVYVAQTGEVR